METIEVTARFDLEGRITPLQFTWQGRTYTIDSTGRRWEDDARRRRFLVMAPVERVFELVFDPSDLRWFVIPRTHSAA